MMLELGALADACEKATGPSFDLEQQIYKAVRPERYQRDLDALLKSPIGPRLSAADYDGYIKPPAYTASIDAALTLIEGKAVLITLSEIKGDGMPICIVGNPETSELFEAVADTMPLALCAAALRAGGQR